MYILGMPYCFLKGKMMSYTRKISETTKNFYMQIPGIVVQCVMLL